MVFFVLDRCRPDFEVSEDEIDDPADYTPVVQGLLFAKRYPDCFLVDMAVLEIPVSLVVGNYRIAELQVLYDSVALELKWAVFVQILVVHSSHSMHRILVVLVGTADYTWRMPASPIADWALR